MRVCLSGHGLIAPNPVDHGYVVGSILRNADLPPPHTPAEMGGTWYELHG